MLFFETQCRNGGAAQDISVTPGFVHWMWTYGCTIFHSTSHGNMPWIEHTGDTLWK